MFSRLSRRQLLRLISGLIAGTAAFGSIPFIGKLFASKAQAQATAKEVIYRNRRYRIIPKAVDNTPRTLQDGARTVPNPFNAPVELYLDGKQVSILRVKKTGKYATYLLPFTQYDSPETLARQLINLGVRVPNVDTSKATSEFDSLI